MSLSSGLPAGPSWVGGGFGDGVGENGLAWRVARWVAVLVSAVLLAGFLQLDDVSRTQEARVAETAREMLGGGWGGWMIPHCNGEVRLRKPPLAYWLSAGSYSVLGVSEFSARLPMALAGAGAVAVTGVIAAWLFSQRCGFFAVCILPGLFLFAKSARLAETDILVALLVTVAMGAFGVVFSRRGAVTVRGGGTAVEGRGEMGWFHLAGTCMGLAFLAKGPPALYPLIFVVVFAVWTRTGVVLKRGLLSGAWVTFGVIAVPWFVVAVRHPDFAQATEDLRNSAEGGLGHSRWFWSYFPQMALALAPWTGLAVLGMVEAFLQWRRDRASNGALLFLGIWMGSMFLPLCFWGNKQIHYLLPLMPPMAVVTAWVCERRLIRGGGAKARDSFAIVFGGTLAVLLIGGIALPLAGRMMRAKAGVGGHLGLDLGFSAAIVVGVIATAVMWRRGLGWAVATLTAVAGVVCPLVLAVWAPTVEARSHREVAERIRGELGAGPYVFISRETSLPMVFALRTVVPHVRDPEEVAARAEKTPGLVAIAIDNVDGKRPTTRPAAMRTVEVKCEDEIVRGYLLSGSER